MSIFTTPQQPGLGELFGQGFSQGLQQSLPDLLKSFEGQRQSQKMTDIFGNMDSNASLQEMIAKIFGAGLSPEYLKPATNIAMNLAKTKGTGLTPYQQLSTNLREKEITRQLERSITEELMKIADPVWGSGVLSKDEVPTVTTHAMTLINGGMSPPQAVDSALNAYRNQRDVIKEISLEKFNPKKADERIKSAINLFKENNVREPNLIIQTLKSKGYSTKARQQILQGLNVKNPIEKEVKIQEIKPKPKFDINNLKHKQRREEILKQVGGDRQKAIDLLLEEFER